MKIYAVYKYKDCEWLYILEKGYNCYYWDSIDTISMEELALLGEKYPVFHIKRNGGQVLDGDMEELCEFSPP